MTTAPLAALRTHPRTAVGALRIGCSDLATIAASLSEEESWRFTRLPGWTVRDLLLHLLGDAQRGLVALSTPAAGPADRDAVSYWGDTPRWPDPQYRDLRAQRVIATAWGLEGLARTFGETGRAVVTVAARTAPDALVATQDRVLRAKDVVTLAVEPRCTISTWSPTCTAPDRGPSRSCSCAARWTACAASRPRPTGPTTAGPLSPPDGSRPAAGSAGCWVRTSPGYRCSAVDEPVDDTFGGQRVRRTSARSTLRTWSRPASTTKCGADRSPSSGACSSRYPPN